MIFEVVVGNEGARRRREGGRGQRQDLEPAAVEGNEVVLDEAATTWRSPATAERVRGNEGLRAWCDGFSLHAGVVVPNDDRDALKRLCRYGARPAFAQEIG